jgi:predicted ATPase
VLRGRCLPYGEGITYWPLAEIVLQLAPGDPRGELASAVAGDELADVVVDRILAAVGAGGQPGPSEETHWAVRRLVEALSADRPVVLVLDDVHWAMPTFLDLIEYLVGFSTGPLLLVCMARDELVEARPSWAGGRSDREIVLLGPLAGSEPRDLVESLAAGRGTPLSDATLGRILDVGEGNPLFLEQLVAAQVEGSDAAGEPLVPATVQALLAARIDRLEHEERRLLERASVEGRVFHRRPLVELTPPAERDSLGASLMALVRKELLEPARPDVPDDDAFRFRHLLLRDAAYAALPKEARWELHRRFADWVESSAVLLLERDEIAGHHLEQAYRYASELGLGTAADRDEVALRGSARLEAGAQRAAQRIDLPAAANLYERSSALLAADDPRRAPLLLGLGAALAELGGLDDAAAAFEEALVTADERTGAHVRVHQLLLRVQTEPERALAELEQVRAQTAPLFAQANDRLGLCKLGQLEGRVQWLRGRAGAAEEAWRAAAADARDAGSERDYSDILAWLASAFRAARRSAARFAPTPMPRPTPCAPSRACTRWPDGASSPASCSRRAAGCSRTEGARSTPTSPTTKRSWQCLPAGTTWRRPASGRGSPGCRTWASGPSSRRRLRCSRERSSSRESTPRRWRRWSSPRRVPRPTTSRPRCSGGA